MPSWWCQTSPSWLAAAPRLDIASKRHLRQASGLTLQVGGGATDLGIGNAVGCARGARLLRDMLKQAKKRSLSNQQAEQAPVFGVASHQEAPATAGGVTQNDRQRYIQGHPPPSACSALGPPQAKSRPSGSRMPARLVFFGQDLAPPPSSS